MSTIEKMTSKTFQLSSLSCLASPPQGACDVGVAPLLESWSCSRVDFLDIHEIETSNLYVLFPIRRL